MTEPAPLPKVIAGTVQRLAQFESAEVPARHVDVWLPPGYPAAAPYAVLYMHDGQMLFDGSQSWNQQEWRVDEVAASLQAAGKVRPFIVVGVWNAGPYRRPEYFPQKAFALLAPTDQQSLLQAHSQVAGKTVAVYSDRYLRFLVNELKPQIEHRFAVSGKAADTFIMGSSMGGLISLYAVAEYPAVFGGAACLSTHWPGTLPDFAGNPVPAVFFRYIEQYFPVAGRHRIYFDYGTETLDASYAIHQQVVDRLLQQKGYSPLDWQTRAFPGADHSEQAWAARLAEPLQFLLPVRRAL
ncbi:MAG: alpha/beta hydrolase [Pseudomonadota bacterium]